MLQRNRERAQRMACLQKASPALKELLMKLCSSVEKPIEIEHNIYESGSVGYHIQASLSESEKIYLSIATPPVSSEVEPSKGLPRSTLQTIQRIYSETADIVEPPEEGFQLTLRLDFNKLPQDNEERIKVIIGISSLQAVILSSQLRDVFWNLGSQNNSNGMYRPIKLVYHPGEHFFVIRMPEKISVIFPMRFRDDSDVVLATAFFQELMDVGCSTFWAKAPRCIWSPIPPRELRGEPFHDLSTNGGFVTFEILSMHVEGSKLDKTVWCLLNFYAYVKHHVKCTKGFIQRRMRKRLENLTEMMQKTSTKADADENREKGGKRVKKMKNFTKTRIFKRKWGAFKKQLMRMSSPIKIQGFAQFHRRWLRMPKFSSFRSYTKLD